MSFSKKKEKLYIYVFDFNLKNVNEIIILYFNIILFKKVYFYKKYKMKGMYYKIK